MKETLSLNLVKLERGSFTFKLLIEQGLKMKNVIDDLEKELEGLESDEEMGIQDEAIHIVSDKPVVPKPSSNVTSTTKASVTQQKSLSIHSNFMLKCVIGVVVEESKSGGSSLVKSTETQQRSTTSVTSSSELFAWV